MDLASRSWGRVLKPCGTFGVAELAVMGRCQVVEFVQRARPVLNFLLLWGDTSDSKKSYMRDVREVSSPCLSGLDMRLLHPFDSTRNSK